MSKPVPRSQLQSSSHPREVGTQVSPTPSHVFSLLCALQPKEQVRVIDKLLDRLDFEQLEVLRERVESEYTEQIAGFDADGLDAPIQSMWALSPRRDYHRRKDCLPVHHQLYIYLRQRKRGSRHHFLGSFFFIEAGHEYLYELAKDGMLNFTGNNTFKLTHKHMLREKLIQFIQLEPPSFDLSEESLNVPSVQIPLHVQFYNPYTLEPSFLKVLDFPLCTSDQGEFSLQDWTVTPFEFPPTH